jgi:hypothetical protein
VAKLVLFSVVIGMFAIPIVTARDANAKRGVKKLVFLMLAFNLFYLFAVRYIYPHLL